MTSASVDAALAQTPDLLESALARLPEDHWFERKSARISPRNLAVPLVAMGNADGGVIVVGMHDGVLEDVPPQRRNAIRQAAMDFTQPPVRMHVEELSVGGDDPRTVTEQFSAWSPGRRCTTPTRAIATSASGTSLASSRLRRSGSWCTTGGRLSTRRHRPRWASMTSTPPSSPATPRSSAWAPRSARPPPGTSSIDGGRVTVAAALLFDERPQRELPNALVRVLRYGADERGVGDAMTLEAGGDRRIEGSIPQQIRAAAETIEPLMPKWQQLGPAGLFEATSRIPRDAWLEGLVNAVVHRSYSTMGDHIRFEIFPNRVEITSPGRFPGLANPSRPLEVTRYARNPRIARVCADLGITGARRGDPAPLQRDATARARRPHLRADVRPREAHVACRRRPPLWKSPRVSRPVLGRS